MEEKQKVKNKERMISWRGKAVYILSGQSWAQYAKVLYPFLGSFAMHVEEVSLI